MFCGSDPRPISKEVLKIWYINLRNELVHVWNNSHISQGPTGLTNKHVSLYQMHTCIVGVRNSRYPYISVYWCITFVYGTLYRSYDGHVRLLWWFFSWLPVGRRNKCHINSSKEDVISLHAIAVLPVLNFVFIKINLNYSPGGVTWVQITMQFHCSFTF